MLIYCCCSVTKLYLSEPMGCSTCPLLSLGVCSNSRSSIRWCYQTISSSAAPFSFCLQSLPSIRVFSSKSALHIKTQMVEKIEGRRRRGQQRMRWLDGIIGSMDMNWANSRKQWGTGRPGMLQSIELHTTLWTWRVGYNLAAEQQKQSAYKLNKQGDNIQPCCTPFPILKQSVVPCKVLTVTFRPIYRFLRRQVRWS